MPFTLGLNILGDRGLSNDNVAAYARDLNPHTCVVINNNKLAAMLLAQGVKVIYRHKSDQPNGNDDDAHLRYNPIDFVNKRNLEAPPGAIIHLTNEPGTGDINKLNQWTLEAMKHCDTIGRKACILNFATGNPQPHHWDMLRDSLTHAALHGHIIGHHDYFDVTVDRSLKYHVGRCLPAVAKYGGQWAITELGCAVNLHPERGWQGALSEEAYAIELWRAAQIYWLMDIPVCIYSYGPWHNFSIDGASTLKRRLVEYNTRMPIAQVHNAETTDRVRIRAGYTTFSQMVALLDKGTKIFIEPIRVKGDSYAVDPAGIIKRNDWYKTLAPYQGWIAAAWVKEYL